jgi:hypothetical protein
MKTMLLIAGLAGMTALFSCKTASVDIDPQLQATAMPVKGRQGLLIGQVIRYGAYETDPVKRGWTSGYDVPFILHFQAAKEKLRFTQHGPEGQVAKVACISRFKSTDLNLIGEFFGIPLNYQNYFAGAIITGNNHWDFLLHNPNGDFLRSKASAGFARRSDHREIEIRAIRGLKDQPEWMKKLTVYGHEFLLDGKVVGAVSTLNRGKVWIDESLDAETRTVLASLATGLLLRTDVENTNMRPLQ